MYILHKRLVITISLIILLFISMSTDKVYKSNITQATDNASKGNAVNTLSKNTSDLNIKIGPPAKGVYQSAITDFGGTEDEVTAKKILDYEKLIGKKIVWAYFSNNWGKEIKFPEKSVKIIHSLGVVPYIRMMPRSTFEDNEPDPIYTLQRIIDGKFDSNLTKWAQDAKKMGFPIMVEFGTEVNANWFPWSGSLNGGGNTTGYGDPAFPDGPERFRDAYRHIIDLFRKEGVNNITWCFHVQASSDLGYDAYIQQPWNSIKNYYPGDNYIDWIGVSIYGNVERGAIWTSFSERLDGVYPELAALSDKKPLAVFEFGVLEELGKGNKTAWIQDALQSIESGRYPRIKAINYWNEKWNDCTIVCVPWLNGVVDITLNSSSQVANTYRKLISSPFFLTQPQYVYNQKN